MNVNEYFASINEVSPSNALLADIIRIFGTALGDDTAADVARLVIRYGDLHAAEKLAQNELEFSQPLLTDDELRHFMETGKENAP